MLHPMEPAPSISIPLTNDECDLLADFVGEPSPFDIDAMLGLLNAVARTYSSSMMACTT